MRFLDWLYRHFIALTRSRRLAIRYAKARQRERIRGERRSSPSFTPGGRWRSREVAGK